MEYDGSEPLERKNHEEFCHHFIRTRSIKEAGEAVGIPSRQNANVVHKRPDVQARIKFLRQEILEELGLDTYYVLSKLKENLEGAMYDEEPNRAAANKSIELIGKHVGMFNDKIKHEHTGADGQPISMNLEVVFTDESDQGTN